MLSQGQVLNEHTVLRELGNGNFGFVFEVESAQHNEPIALKVCGSFQQEDTDRFRQENSILHHLTTHPHIIIPLSDIRDEPPYLYYVMELADFNLDAYLKQAPTLGLEEKLALFREICVGMEHAHSNQVVHRDLWWNNILLKGDGAGAYSVKLTDFGRAKDFTLGGIAYSENVKWGIKAVIPPEIFFNVWEQAELANYVRGDIYALGILLYFILASAPTNYYVELFSDIADFERQNPLSTHPSFREREGAYEKWLQKNQGRKFGSLDVLVPDLPGKTSTSAKLNALIRKASHIDYRERHLNMGELIAELDSI